MLIRNIINGFRSSAGFSKKSIDNDFSNVMDVKVRKKQARAESARKRKIPPTHPNKEKLNDLKEAKIDQEKVSSVISLTSYRTKS